MSIEEEIKKIEEGAKKKENYIKTRTDQEYAPKVEEIEVILIPIRDEFKAVEKSITDLNNKIKQLKKRKTELILAAQPLMKDLKKISKEKAKFLEKELKAITKEKKIKEKSINK